MTILVTGAAGAIGRACVQQFVDRGHQVFAQDLDASSWADTPAVTPISGNLLDPQLHATIDRVIGDGELTAVVAAHGVAGSSTLPDCTPEFVDRVLAVNASTVPLLFDTVRTHLERTGGAFIAVASQAALTGEAGNIAYCAAKFAVLGWVREMASRSTGVTVHALCPGATNSDLLIAAQKRFAAAEGVTSEEYYAQRARQIAIGRYGEPHEIAAAAEYLATRGRRPVVLAVTGGDVMY